MLHSRSHFLIIDHENLEKIVLNVSARIAPISDVNVAAKRDPNISCSVAEWELSLKGQNTVKDEFQLTKSSDGDRNTFALFERAKHRETTNGINTECETGFGNEEEQRFRRVGDSARHWEIARSAITDAATLLHDLESLRLRRAFPLLVPTFLSRNFAFYSPAAPAVEDREKEMLKFFSFHFCHLQVSASISRNS